MVEIDFATQRFGQWDTGQIARVDSRTGHRRELFAVAPPEADSMAIPRQVASEGGSPRARAYNRDSGCFTHRFGG